MRSAATIPPLTFAAVAVTLVGVASRALLHRLAPAVQYFIDVVGGFADTNRQPAPGGDGASPA